MVNRNAGVSYACYAFSDDMAHLELLAKRGKRARLESLRTFVEAS